VYFDSKATQDQLYAMLAPLVERFNALSLHYQFPYRGAPAPRRPMRQGLPCHSEDAVAIVPEAGAGGKLSREGGEKVATSSASAGWAARSRRACSRAITISWSSIGTPEKAVGLGQMAAKVAGSIAAAQNAPLTSKPLFFRCRITSFILQRIPRSSEGNHHGAVR
jgi:hypothetical protein